MKDPYLSYHEGEREVQTRAGVGSEGLGAEEMYRGAMPAGVQRFLSLQQFAALSTMDADGRLWASMRSGAPGFLRSLDDHTVEIGGYAHPDDPLPANLAAHGEAGMVVVHLAARHRVRVNGTASARPDGKIVLTTKQVYGNCPQYIQARAVVGESESSAAPGQRGKTLDERQQRWVERADTLFIATANPGPARMLLIVEGNRGSSESRMESACCFPTTRATRCSTRWATSLLIRAPASWFPTSNPAPRCNSQAPHKFCGTIPGWRNLKGRSAWSPSKSSASSNCPRRRSCALSFRATRRFCAETGLQLHQDFVGAAHDRMLHFLQIVFHQVEAIDALFKVL
jgi:predicted pyridoxine 5'-phosphate oxidase superfamily flavin-nucleotide-binding protein